MSFTGSQILFLQRLVNDKPKERRAADIARHFAEHYSIGSIVGRQVQYHEEHHQAAISLLRAHDLPVVSLGSDASRADVAVYSGLSEKSLSVSPHSKSIAVKFFGACKVDGQQLTTPAGAHMIVTPQLGTEIACDRLLVVENFETFRRLNDYQWLRFDGLSVMAVYRGDPGLHVGDALDLIRGRKEPIWSFADFDPAGLLIANSLPSNRLERVVLPAQEWLQDAANGARGRQLFADQVQMCARTLDQSSNEQIRYWWKVMQALQSAVTQERMLLAPTDTADR